MIVLSDGKLSIEYYIPASSKELYFTMTLSILVASSGMSCVIFLVCGWHEAFAYVFALLVERVVCPSGRDTAYEKQSVWYFLFPQG